MFGERNAAQLEAWNEVQRERAWKVIDDQLAADEDEAELEAEAEADEEDASDMRREQMRLDPR